MKSPTLPILLGLSLCSIGGAAIYVYLKKKKEPETETDGTPKISSKLNLKPKKNEELETIEIILANNVVPLVIGRKGITVKHIEENTGTKIKFRVKDENNHVCTITGTLEGVEKAEFLIQKEAARPPTLTEEILVPQTACGKILGRCGDALQEICRKSMSKVWIDTGSRNLTDIRRVLITGTQSQINVAKSLIEEKVKDDAEARKTQEQVELRREPRIRSPPTSITATPIPREILPPVVEKLKSSSSSGQLEVFVSAVVSPSHFYLQLVGPQSTELDILVDAMTEYYAKQESRELHTIREPYLGQIVAAEFNADNKWYRAEIIAILPNEFKPNEIVLDLYFVDYGDNQYIKPCDVYELRPDFLALRFQAIECFLAHVEPNNEVSSTTGVADEEWEPSAVTRFEDLTHSAQWRKLLSKIATYKNRGHKTGREGSPIPGVELYDTTSDGVDVNIALELVNEGYAKMSHNFGDLSRSSVLRLDVGSAHSSIDNLSLKEVAHHTKNSEPKPVPQPKDTTPAVSSTNNVEAIEQNGNFIAHETIPETTENAINNKMNGSANFLKMETHNNSSNRLPESPATVAEPALVTPTRSRLFPVDWNELVEEDERNGNILH